MWNVHQIRSAQWTVQKNKKWYKSNTTQEHIYGKKREIRIKCAKQWDVQNNEMCKKRKEKKTVYSV